MGFRKERNSFAWVKSATLIGKCSCLYFSTLLKNPPTFFLETSLKPALFYLYIYTYIYMYIYIYINTCVYISKIWKSIVNYLRTDFKYLFIILLCSILSTSKNSTRNLMQRNFNYLFLPGWVAAHFCLISSNLQKLNLLSPECKVLW